MLSIILFLINVSSASTIFENFYPSYIKENIPFKIKCKIKNDLEINKVCLLWDNDGELSQNYKGEIQMNICKDEFFETTEDIPAQRNGGRFVYKIEAYDKKSNYLCSENQELSALPVSSLISDVYVYPQPILEGKGGHFHYVLSEKLDDIKVEIYTLNGNLVKQLCSEFNWGDEGGHSIDWNGKDEWERDVRSSVLFLSIKATKGEKTVHELRKFIIWKKE
jgi:hypothetical protein